MQKYLAGLERWTVTNVSKIAIQRILLRIWFWSRRIVTAPMLTSVLRGEKIKIWTALPTTDIHLIGKMFPFPIKEVLFYIEQMDVDAYYKKRQKQTYFNHLRPVDRTSVMIWGMVSKHSQCAFITVYGNVEGFKCVSVLADHIHPYMHIAVLGHDAIFQYDNMTSHTAGITRE